MNLDSLIDFANQGASEIAKFQVPVILSPEKEKLSSQMNQPSSTSLSDSWFANGGTAHDGMTYGPPTSALPYGTAGCPLAPRLYRSALGEIELPTGVCAAFGVPHVTVADLESDAWQRWDIPELSPESRQGLSAFFYQLPVPEKEIAIPGGVPISWLTALPITPRLRNALRRHYRDQVLVDTIDCVSFLNIRNVGITALTEMLCVLESAELGVVSGQMSPKIPSKPKVMTEAQFQAAVREEARKAIRASCLIGSHFQELASWALSETGAKTVGEAIAQTEHSPSAAASWQAVTRMELSEVSEHLKHPYDIIESWVADLPEREGYIFQNRVAHYGRSHTLQELADYLGITRERVRQLEKRVLSKFMAFTRQVVASPIRWRIETIKQMIGIAAPLTRIEQLLRPSDGQTDYRFILLRLAGPYDMVEEWVVLRSALAADPTAKILDMANEVGAIDSFLSADELNNWGLDSAFHEGWLVRNGRIRNMNGRLFRWDGAIGDKLISALSDLSRPATVDTLLNHTGEARARTSAINALSIDSRVVKANLTEWALASWGVPEYSGIAVEIGELLEHEGQPMLQQDITSRLHEDFGTSESSVRAYCQAPMFISRNGWVRLRTEDEPFTYPNRSPRNTKGVFVLGPQRVGILIEVDQETLRGSGRALTMAAGATLNVCVGEALVFKNETGHSVTVTFPGTSLLGPLQGSVRSFAESSHAKLGDQLCLILDRSDMSATAIITDVALHDPGWQLVTRLTGIEANSGIKGLASALNCSEGEVRALLKSRGDDAVAQAIPVETSSSSGLDEALSSLEAQLQKR